MVRVAAWSRQILSVVAAVCVSVLGFLRPEARYKNLVRAWRQLDLQKTRYLFGNSRTERLLRALGRTEQLAELAIECLIRRAAFAECCATRRRSCNVAFLDARLRRTSFA